MQTIPLETIQNVDTIIEALKEEKKKLETASPLLTKNSLDNGKTDSPTLERRSKAQQTVRLLKAILQLCKNEEYASRDLTHELISQGLYSLEEGSEAHRLLTALQAALPTPATLLAPSEPVCPSIAMNTTKGTWFKKLGTHFLKRAPVF